MFVTQDDFLTLRTLVSSDLFMAPLGTGYLGVYKDPSIDCTKNLLLAGTQELKFTMTGIKATHESVQSNKDRTVLLPGPYDSMKFVDMDPESKISLRVTKLTQIYKKENSKNGVRIKFDGDLTNDGGQSYFNLENCTIDQRGNVRLNSPKGFGANIHSGSRIERLLGEMRNAGRKVHSPTSWLWEDKALWHFEGSDLYQGYVSAQGKPLSFGILQEIRFNFLEKPEFELVFGKYLTQQRNKI
jgi:hypothetical protein